MIIEIIGKFFDNHSLSIINRNLAIGLAAKNDVYITPLDGFTPDAKLDKEIVKKLKTIMSKKWGKKEADLQIRHSYPPIWRWPVSAKTKVIYIQPWEHSKQLLEWQYKWEQFADALIVPSKWQANHVLNAGINPDKLYVVPNGFDDKIFNQTKVAAPSFMPTNSKNFIYVGCAQWRKGLDILLNAWKTTFKRSDNVCLIIKDTPQIYGTNNVLNEIVKLQYHNNCGKIIYLDDNFSNTELAAIYKNSDVVVQPFRAEAFGMPIQEAVACGCIPITPEYAPTEEFIGDVGLKIGVKRINIDMEDKQVFALRPGDSTTMMNSYGAVDEPDSESLKASLKRYYYSHTKEQFLEKVKNFKLENTWENVIVKYENALKNIAKKEGTQRG